MRATVVLLLVASASAGFILPGAHSPLAWRGTLTPLPSEKTFEARVSDETRCVHYVPRARGERVLLSADRVARFDRRLTRRLAELGRATKLWLPYAVSVAGGSASLVALGRAGIGGLTAAAGVTLAKTNAAATLGYTAWAGLQYGLLGGDGEWVARKVGGTPAAPASTAARVVADVSARFEHARLAERPPGAWIIPTDEPNAFAAGRGDRTIVALSAGLLRRLDRDELSAVVAHELAHVAHADVGQHMQQAAMVAGFTGTMRLGHSILESDNRKSKRKSKSDDDDDSSSSLVPGLALMAVGAVQAAAGTVTRLATSRGDEFAADAAAARLPGGAEALARALRKIEHAAKVEGVRRDALGGSHGAALASCYIANDAAHDRPARLGEWLSTHPTTDRRVSRLKALAAAEHEEVNAAPAAARRRESWGAVIVDALDPPSLAFV